MPPAADGARGRRACAGAGVGWDGDGGVQPLRERAAAAPDGLGVLATLRPCITSGSMAFRAVVMRPGDLLHEPQQRLAVAARRDPPGC
jgi:hypothetical protein